MKRILVFYAFFILPYPTFTTPVVLRHLSGTEPKPNSSHEVHYARVSSARYNNTELEAYKRVYDEFTDTKQNFADSNIESWMSAEDVSKTIEENPSDGACTHATCIRICEVINMESQNLMAQCLDKNCFCFKKEELFPPSMREFLKTQKLFGIPQQYQ